MLLSFRQARRLQRIALACAFCIAILLLYTYYMNAEVEARQEKLSLYIRVEDPEGLKAYQNMWVGFQALRYAECTPLFIKSTKNSLYPRSLPRVETTQLSLESKACLSFLSKYGFNRYIPVTAEERDFPLAYIILFHKDLQQVLFLLRAIYRRHNIYCLNIDLDAGPAFIYAVKSITRCFNNVFVTERLESITYASYSRFAADLNCMQELVTRSTKWKYLHNIPGQQFPLRTNLEMVKIVKTYKGANDILGLSGKKSLPRRYKYVHRLKYDNNTGKNIIIETASRKPPPPHGFRIVKGSAYGSFSRAFVEFILHNENVSDLIKWSQDIESPDEYIYSTVHFTDVMDVPGGYKVNPKKKKYLASFTAWETESPCASKFVRWICIFTPADLPMLVDRPELFANKFYIDYFPAALHCLDQYLYNLTVAGKVRNLEYYKELSSDN